MRESFTYTQETLSGSERAGRVVIEITKDSPVELFIAVALDTAHKVIGASVISSGTLDAALVHPREVFRFAFLCNAAAIIVGHNHPSGNTDPSSPDKAVFRRLQEAGELLGIRVLDSIVCNDTSFVSMAQIT